MSEAPLIGIDLGTTYSCVAVYRDKGGKHGGVEVIPSEQGKKTMPSIVSFNSEDGCLVGEAAKHEGRLNPQNNVYDAKRMIGREFNDDTLQQDMKLWSFKVINDKGRPKIEIDHCNKIKYFYPEEISAKVLMKLKEMAEKYLMKPVRDAVVSVPAYFSEKQRQATRHAATIAGLNVLCIINEPTAAAIAYGFEKKFAGKRTVLVYDFGGGTFDVTLLKIEGDEYDVIATSGNNHLGGIDIDNNMVKHFVAEIKEKYGEDLSDNKTALNKLRERCEMAKREISSPGQPKSVVLVDNLYDGKSFKGLITRSRFNIMNDGIFKSTLEPLQTVLNDAKIKAKDIDDVVLAGGSTKIPQVRSMLEEFFGNKPIASVNPDEIVAQGAAIRAASFRTNEKHYSRVKNINIRDICSLSLGIGSHGNVMSVLIPRNTKLPASGSQTFTTSEHNQTSVCFPVYEGERVDCRLNSLVAEFTLEDIEAQPMGKATIDVKFNLNEEGILTVSAKDRSTGKETTSTQKKGALPQREVNRLLLDAEKFEEEDRLLRTNAEAKNNLDRYAYDARYRSGKESIGAPNRKQIAELCDDVVDWIESNKFADKSQFENRLDDLQDVCEPLLGNE